MQSFVLQRQQMDGTADPSPNAAKRAPIVTAKQIEQAQNLKFPVSKSSMSELASSDNSGNLSHRRLTKDSFDPELDPFNTDLSQVSLNTTSGRSEDPVTLGSDSEHSSDEVEDDAHVEILKVAERRILTTNETRHQNDNLCAFEFSKLVSGGIPPLASTSQQRFIKETMQDLQPGQKGPSYRRLATAMAKSRNAVQDLLPASDEYPTSQQSSSATTNRATGAPSGVSDTSIPPARGEPNTGFKRFGGAEMKMRPFQDSAFTSQQPQHNERPKTSHGPQARAKHRPQVQAVHQQAEWVPRHEMTKSSTLGDSSDPESAPSSEYQNGTLDYSLEELKSIDFKDLQAESVDTKKDVDMEVIRHVTSAKDLDELLQAAANIDDRDLQKEILRSLNIEQWQEAGDWMITQLVNVMTKLVSVRRQKRRLAQELEGEIAQRHQDVVKHEAAIKRSMASMRTEGSRIMAVGTPKRKK